MCTAQLQTERGSTLLEDFLQALENQLITWEILKFTK